jgi:hypothetical protein
MLRRVALRRMDVSEERSPSFMSVTRIGELGTTLTVTNIPLTWYFFAACVGCQLQLALFLIHRFLSPWWKWLKVPPKCRLLQEPYDVTSQKAPFFIQRTDSRYHFLRLRANSTDVHFSPLYCIYNTCFSLIGHLQVYRLVFQGNVSSLFFCGFKFLVRFEVFTVVTTKNAVFWDNRLCGSCENRRFLGTCRLHHHGDKNWRAKNGVSNN